jgi:hypothetical protein
MFHKFKHLNHLRHPHIHEGTQHYFISSTFNSPRSDNIKLHNLTFKTLNPKPLNYNLTSKPSYLNLPNFKTP